MNRTICAAYFALMLLSAPLFAGGTISDEELAKRGDELAQLNLGYAYMVGQGVAKDPWEGMRWLNKAAEAGLGEAQYLLGYFLIKGEIGPHDERKGLEWLKRASEDGNAKAEYALGLMYATGENVSKDLGRAYVLWQCASAEGHDGARRDLLVLAKQLTPEQKREADAAARDALALRQSMRVVRPVPIKQERPIYPIGMVKSGAPGVVIVTFYVDKVGNVRYPTTFKSSHWAFEPSAIATVNKWKFQPGTVDGKVKTMQLQVPIVFQLLEEGQAPLPEKYQNEFIAGVLNRTPHTGEFFATLRLALAGEASAQFNVGYMYSHADGIGRDDAEAVQWYHRAALQGFAQAQANLGFMYANGVGTPKDLVQAHVWWSLAGAAGIEDARANVSAIEKLMTPDQIAEAMRQARLIAVTPPKK